MAQSRDGVFTWIHADHLSSATRITDMNGLEIRRLAYRSFGEEAENQGSGDDPKYKYTGKEQDSTGLYYYGARYYDPALSRFITADTVYDAGPQGLNRYSYALNNPIIYRDPTGHQVEHWYQTVWVKPIETVQSTVNAGLVWVEEASGHHPYVIANTVPVKTISDTNFGALKSGMGMVTLGEEIGEWGADRKNPNKIPVVGRIGEDLGTSVGEFIVDPSVETGARVVAATAAAVGTALGGVQLARMLGVPGTQGNPIKTQKKPDRIPEKLYRKANPNRDKVLTPREGDEGSLSCEEVLANPIEFKDNPIFPPKKQWIEIDPKLLPKQGKELIYYGDRPTHWGIPEEVVPDDIRKAITAKSSGKGNPPPSWR